MTEFPNNPDDVAAQLSTTGDEWQDESCFSQLIFTMPSDQDWGAVTGDKDFWGRIGQDPGFGELDKAMASVGAKIDDVYDVIISFPEARRAEVKAILRSARNGKFGADVATYWSQARAAEWEI